uniref:Uncharacterized protein n=1 Tax=Anguilla anguilla TaxID=7936 RepID=A0A0E9XDK3_ANGAN
MFIWRSGNSVSLVISIPALIFILLCNIPFRPVFLAYYILLVPSDFNLIPLSPYYH